MAQHSHEFRSGVTLQGRKAESHYCTMVLYHHYTKHIQNTHGITFLDNIVLVPLWKRIKIKKLQHIILSRLCLDYIYRQRTIYEELINADTVTDGSKSTTKLLSSN